MDRHEGARSHGAARVCAVMVTYHPDVERFAKALDAVAKQVETVLIVDNTPEPCSPGQPVDKSSVEVLRLGSNVGVAGAHNVGIAWARAHGYTHVLLMDQDSVPAPDMVAKLLEAEAILKTKEAQVAAVAPRFSDPRSNQTAPFIGRRGWRILKIDCRDGSEDYRRIDYAISSGILISMEALDAVGDMDETLFIDYVDIEWGLRARRNGYASFGVCGARMEHYLGDSVMTLPWLIKRKVPVRNPLRHYYHFRNALHLYKKPYAPLPWIVNDALRLLRKYVFYMAITPPRWQHCKMMTLGLWHGVRGLSGPYPGNALRPKG